MSPAFAAVFGLELADAAVLCDENGTLIEQETATTYRGFGRWGNTEFTSEAAAITGENVRSIQRHIARAEALGDDIDRLAGTTAWTRVWSRIRCPDGRYPCLGPVTKIGAGLPSRVPAKRNFSGVLSSLTKLSTVAHGTLAEVGLMHSNALRSASPFTELD